MYQLPNLGQGKQRHHPYKVTRGVFSPYCTCSLGLHVSTERTVTTVQSAALQPPLAGLLPLQQFSWQDVSIIAAPAVNCVARVIVRGVKKKKKSCAETAWAKETSVEPQWMHATSLSPVDLSRFGCHGQCICHNVSAPLSQPSTALAGVKSFIFLFISGLGSHLS